VSPAQPWVQAPNTSALARHGDSLCQRRRQSSRHSLHHHDTDSHWQFRPRHTTPPNWTPPPTHTHVRRRVFGQVPSSCCSPPPPVKAGRAPKPCIDAAGAARPACTTTACGGPNHDTRTPHAGGAWDSRSTMRPARCQATPCPTNAARQPPSRVVGSATSVAPPHTPEARDHHTRATRPASTARVSPAQPWVQAPNTSALACHGDSLCQRRRQSSRHSLHHHDADLHWQFRPRHRRHTSTH
jgi:hypothetical protein